MDVQIVKLDLGKNRLLNNLKMKTTLFHLAYIFSIFLSCNSMNDKSFNRTINIQSIDTFKVDIPDKKESPQNVLKRLHQANLLLQFENLENGFHDLQIRLRFGYSRKDTSQFVIFKKINSKWSALLINADYVLNFNQDSVIRINKDQRIKEPKSGWPIFEKKIIDLGILNLPDETKIQNYPQYADGDVLTVEIATPNLYRLYSYSEPLSSSKSIKEAKAIEEFLVFIDEEFDFKRLRNL